MDKLDYFHYRGGWRKSGWLELRSGCTAGKKGGVEQTQHHLREGGSSGNTRGCCLKGVNSFFRRGVKPPISLAVAPHCSPQLLRRGLPSSQVRVASQQAGGKPATF